jgi:hypothetical protein
MNLSAPKQLVFLISLVLFIIGALNQFSSVSVPYDHFAYLAAWVLLALGCLLKGL